MKTTRKVFLGLFILLSIGLLVFGLYGLGRLQNDKEIYEEKNNLVLTIAGVRGREELSPEIPEVDISALRRENSDCIGWLYIPGTDINYPVMYTPEEPQKYLHMSFDEEYSAHGNLFMDSRCTLTSDNVIIYGHNMTDGTMFAPLKGYEDEDFLKEHQTIFFYSNLGKDEYTVSAVIRASPRTAADEESIYNLTDVGPSYDIKEFLKRNSFIYEEDVPVGEKKMLSLSTCSTSGGSSRLVVVAFRNEGKEE